MRQIILTILGIGIMVAAFFITRNLMNSADEKIPAIKAKTTKVYTMPVENEPVEISVEVNGRLEAIQKIDIFSEVQGVFSSGRLFRPGTYYNKGDLLISVDRQEELAGLKAQRASLLNQIVQFLPDIKFDYPEEYEKWAGYVADFDLEAPVQELPQANSEREKFFIAGKNIASVYYNIKNLEARLSKFRVYAPFSGVLTEALVQPGALIRPGQKIGELTNQYNFELELPIREEYADMVEIGTKIKLMSKDENDAVIEGTVVRINPVVDPGSQSINTYVRVTGKKLKEGMYFTAQLPLEPVEDAMEIDRKLLVQNQFVFGVEDSTLVTYEVIPRHYKQETVIVTGLEQGSRILARMIPAAREGMKVEIVSE